MAQYISKDAVVAKIDDWRHNIMTSVANIPLHGRQRVDAIFEHEILGHVRDFLDTLEVKEVDLEEELESFIEHRKAWVKGNSEVEYNNGDSFNHIYDLRDIAKHFLELGIKVAQKGE